MTKTSSPNKNTKRILAALIIAIAFLSYLLFWDDERQPVELSDQAKSELLTSQEMSDPQPASKPQSEPTSSADLEGLEPTPLDLSLLGTVVSDDEQQASATIKSRLQVRTYFKGDQIAYTNATLEEIRNDRVILLNQGSREVLLLQGTQVSDSATYQAPAPQNANRSSANNDRQADSDTAKSIGNRPQQLEHIVSLMPYYSGEGYLVSPGLNPALFKAARFQEGDVLQKVNGQDISTDEGLAAVQQMIPRVDTLVFSVLRGGRTLSLYIDIPAEGLKLRKN